MSTRILALVEGQTEETFVREILAPDLATHEKYLSAFLIGEPGRKGGIRKYSAVRREFLHLLQGDKNAYVTSMFDYYALPIDFPGSVSARGCPSPEAKAETLERELVQDVARALGPAWNPSKFVPYIQMHEFEAVLFSDPDGLAKGIAAPDLSAPLQAIRRAFDSPEHIDDGPATHPAKRIESLFPGYQKPLHGLLAALQVGLDKMLGECPHFASWVGRLRALP